MLSAIAARKAAAAAAAGSSADISLHSPPSTSKPSSSTSKRKRSQGALSVPQVSERSTPSSQKKRKKDYPPPKLPRVAQPRYFEPQAPQEDIIALEKDDNSTDYDDDSDEEGTADIAVEMNVDQGPSKKKNRSYSPSRPIPLDDSSDDSEQQETVGHAGDLQVNRPMTTFIPVQGQNTFYLTAEEASSLLPSTSNSETLGGTFIALKPSEKLTLLGTYRLNVVRGSIKINGAILQNSNCNVFAPWSSPLPCIHALSASHSSLVNLPERIQVAEGDVLVLLQELWTGVEGLGKVCRTFEGVFSVHPRDLNNRDEGQAEGGDAIRLKGVRTIIHQSKYVSPLLMPSTWERALDAVHDGIDNDVEMREEDQEQGKPLSPIHLIKGPKKVGKSSFARALINRLLARHRQVVYLECDLGQSEFTPGGMVALNIVHCSQPLLGPPFTHPTNPVRAHFLGALSPKTSPGHYIEAIKDLIGYWTREIGIRASVSTESIISVVPLVVNTMGWTKGLGADLTRKVEGLLLDSLSELSLESLLGSNTKELGAEMNLYEFDYETGREESMARPHSQTLPPNPSAPPSYPLFFGHEAGMGTYSSSLFHPVMATAHPPPRTRIHRMESVPLLGPPYASSVITASTNFSAADHRTLNILSYFHAVFPSGSVDGQTDHVQGTFSTSPPTTATQWDTSLPLLAHPPYQVDVSVAVDKVVLLSAPGGEVVEEEIERVLGGALVGLVRCEPGMHSDNGNEWSTESSSFKMKTTIPYVPSDPYPSPSTSYSIGLGLVRSVVPGGSHLHVLTPLPPGLLGSSSYTGSRLSKEGRLTLVKGEMELPIWGMVDFRTLGSGASDRDTESSLRQDTPFLQWEKGVGLGAEKRRVRRNIMRKGQGV